MMVRERREKRDEEVQQKPHMIASAYGYSELMDYHTAL
jgi:hypothetical protein